MRTREMDCFVINRMYAGDYLKGNNIGYEIINLFADDNGDNLYEGQRILVIVKSVFVERNAGRGQCDDDDGRIFRSFEVFLRRSRC